MNIEATRVTYFITGWVNNDHNCLWKRLNLLKQLPGRFVLLGIEVVA